MNARTYDPSKLPAHLLASYKRFGGLTADELKSLEEPALDIDHILRAFRTALAQGVTQPKMHVDGYTFKNATKHSGTVIYVTEDTSGFNEYLGKIVDGKFLPVASCTAAQKAAILAACADPLAAMVKFGRKFGKCSVCNRTLKDPESIARAIGPICASRMGF